MMHKYNVSVLIAVLIKEHQVYYIKKEYLMYTVL